MADMRETLVLDCGDCTTGKGKNGNDTLLTTRNLLFMIVLIQIGTIGYILFKPQGNNYEKYRKTMDVTLDRLRSDIDRNGESIKDVKSMYEMDVKMINSTVAGLKLDVEQMKKRLVLASTTLTLAALNEPQTGNMNGWVVDALCRDQAKAAGYNTSFESFLGGTSHRIYNNVPDSLRFLNIVNTKGETLFNSWNSLFNGDEGKFSPDARFFSFSGKNVLTDSKWPQKVVWHGALPTMDASSAPSCNSWHDDRAESQGLASSLSTHKLLSQETFSCNNQFIVLCIQKSITANNNRSHLIT